MITQEAQVLLPANLKAIQNLQDYIDIGGLKGLQKARTLSPRDVIAEVKKSGLRGRGGAGFPTGIKWESVASDSGQKFVVCNAAEGEPGTYKDRYLLTKNPYQMLEGILIVSYAVGAKKAYIGIKKKFTAQVERIKSALKEMEQANIIEEGFLKIVLGPDDYLFGEEKALLEVIDGRGAMPRILPPYMQGVGFTPTSHNPTVVNNVETMSNLPHILANGADWYRSIGTDDSPGTMILTLSGDVKKPGMYELPMGTKLSEFLYDVGGGPARDHDFQAVFSGVANPVITPDQFDTTMDFGSLRSAGSGLGSGGFMAFDESMCMVKVAVMFSQFLANSSCGQCLPCNMGCRTITDYLQNLESRGGGSQRDIDNIKVELGRVTNQTRCYLPVQESKLIASMIEKFPQEFEMHSTHSCIYDREPVLPKLESFDEEARQFVYEHNVCYAKTI